MRSSVGFYLYWLRSVFRLTCKIFFGDALMFVSGGYFWGVSVSDGWKAKGWDILEWYGIIMVTLFLLTFAIVLVMEDVFSRRELRSRKDR